MLIILSVNPTAPITTTSIGLLIAGRVSTAGMTRAGHTLQGDESLYRLQEYAQAQREQEHAVEKRAEQSGSLPAVGKRDVGIFSISLFRYLARLTRIRHTVRTYQQGDQRHDEADQIIKLARSATPCTRNQNIRSGTRPLSALLNAS
jgi:hypothetical protein